MKYNEEINVKEWNQKFYDYLILNRGLLKDHIKIEEYHKDIYSITNLLQEYSFLGFDILNFEIVTGYHGMHVSLLMDNFHTESGLPYYEPTDINQEIDYDTTKVITNITEDEVLFWFYPDWLIDIKLPEDFTCIFTYQMYCCFIEFYRLLTK